MTKTTYRRKHLIGGLFTVSEDQSMVIMVWSMLACRQTSCWRVTERLHPDARHERGLGKAWAFELKALPSVTHLFQQGHLLILPKQSTNWEQGIQIYEPVRAILNQTIKEGKGKSVSEVPAPRSHCVLEWVVGKASLTEHMEEQRWTEWAS